jgi:hypothetical protein
MMKVTKRKVRGEGRWVVSIDGHPVGDVCKQATGGILLPYRPYRYTDERDEAGDRVLRALSMQSTLEGAVEALAIACGKTVMIAISDRVEVMGVGLTPAQVKELAGSIRQTIEGFAKMGGGR